MTKTTMRALKPSLLFAAGSFAGTAQAQTVVSTNYLLTNPGTPVDINIGGNATPQYTFDYTNKTFPSPDPKLPPAIIGSTAEITGHNGAKVSKSASSAAFYPDPTDIKSAISMGSSTKGSVSNGYYGLLFDLNGVQQTGYALVTAGPRPVASAFPDNGDGTANGVMISEIGYKAVALPVPEPESWAMMIVGFGSIGTVLRRRRRAAQAGSLATA